MNQPLPSSDEHQLPHPALRWIDGHILGNGDVGAVVWGTPEQLSIGLSKHNVWELSHARPEGNRWDASYPAMRERILRGERAFLQKIGNHPYVHSNQAYQLPCGVLDLQVMRGEPWIEHRQTLWFRKAECHVNMIPSDCGFMWGAEYRPVEVTCFVHAQRNILYVRLHSDLVRRIKWSYSRPHATSLPAPTFSVASAARSVAVMRHTLSETDSYAIALGTLATDFTINTTPDSIGGTLTFGGETGDAVLMVAISSQRDPGGVEACTHSQRLLNDALDADSAALVAEHQRWWGGFWEGSDIQYSEPALDQMWHMALYTMASSIRPHTSPPNLQGLWNQFELPPWHTDFHNNTNMQECHYGFCQANHPELLEALARCLTHDWREQFRRYARDEFEAPGLAVPFCNDWLGRSLGGWVFDVEMSVTAWIAQLIWWMWVYTQDRSRLRDEWLPFLRECCQFYESILHEDSDGQFNIELSHSPEQFGRDKLGNVVCVTGRNPAIDIAMIRVLLEAFAEGCNVLRLEDPLAVRCLHIAAHLPPLPQRDGLLIDHEISYHPDGDRIGDFPQCHRTPSRLAAIYPAGQIGLHSDPAILDLGRRSFRDFLSHGNLDFSGWSYTMQSIIAARLGLADDAERCLNELRQSFTLPGLLTCHNRLNGPVYGDPVFQIEALLGVPAALGEILLQSVGGVLRLFPSIPSGRTASFRQLRAPGGVLVSAAWDGISVHGLQIVTENDLNVRLLNPFACRQVQVCSSDDHRLDLAGEIIEWRATRKVIYRIAPADARPVLSQVLNPVSLA